MCIRDRGNPTTAVLLQKCQPLCAVFFAALLLGERLRRQHWLYLALAMGAAYLVSFGERGLLAPFRTRSPLDALPGLLALGAAALWALSTVLGRYLAPRLPFAALTALRITAALPPLSFLVLRERHAHSLLLEPRQWSTLLALALLPGLAALLLYYRGLRGTPASLAAIAELCFPATAALLNWVFLGARLAPLQALGFLLLWAVILEMERERQSGKWPAAPEQTSVATVPCQAPE